MKLSINTDKYLCDFKSILVEMIKNMTDIKPTESISGDFIAAKIPHHLAAIEMSENLLKYTINCPLQNIALNIIASQRKSIENMLASESKCRQTLNCQNELSYYRFNNDEILNIMFRRMKTACSDNCIDANFMREMIPHHQGAIQMSENALKFNICPELKPILEAIIASQKRGVKKMKRLLAEISC